MVRYRRTQIQYDFTLDASIDKRLQVNMDLTIAMPCTGTANHTKMDASILMIHSFIPFTVLLVHVYDVSGQRLHLSDNLKMIPVR